MRRSLRSTPAVVCPNGERKRARARAGRRGRSRRAARMGRAAAQAAARRASAASRAAAGSWAGARGSVVVALPPPPELRADAGAVAERGATRAAADVERLVEAAEPGRPRSRGDLALLLGACDGFLALSYPAADPRWSAEYAREALDDAAASIDRLRAAAFLLPGHALAVEDLRPPIGATHPLRVAEAVTRLGASPLDEDAVERLEP